MFLHILAIVLCVKNTLNTNQLIEVAGLMIIGSLSCLCFVQTTLDLIKLLK